jgi:hypothetical protein
MNDKRGMLILKIIFCFALIVAALIYENFFKDKNVQLPPLVININSNESNNDNYNADNNNSPVLYTYDFLYLEALYVLDIPKESLSYLKNNVHKYLVDKYPGRINTISYVAVMEDSVKLINDNLNFIMKINIDDNSEYLHVSINLNSFEYFFDDVKF